MFFINVDGAQSSSGGREISTTKKRNAAETFVEPPKKKVRDFQVEMIVAQKKREDQSVSSLEQLEESRSKRLLRIASDFYPNVSAQENDVSFEFERSPRSSADSPSNAEDNSSVDQKPFDIVAPTYITGLNDIPSKTPQSLSEGGRSYHGVDEKRLKSELMKIFAMIIVFFFFLYLLFLSGSNAYRKHDNVHKYSSLNQCIDCVNAAYENPDQEFFMKPCESKFDHIYNCSGSPIFTTLNTSVSTCTEFESLDNINLKGGIVHVNSTFNYIVTFWIAISVYILIIAGAALCFVLEYEISPQRDFFGVFLNFLLLVTFFWWLFTILFLAEVHNTGTFIINGVTCFEKRIPNKIDSWLATLFIILWTLPLQAIIAACFRMLETVAMELFFATLAILFLTMIAVGHIGDSDLTYVFGGGMVVLFAGLGAFLRWKYKRQIRKDKEESYI